MCQRLLRRCSLNNGGVEYSDIRSVYECIYMCIQIYIHVHTHSCTLVPMHTHIPMHTHAYTPPHTFAQACTTCTHVPMHAHMYSSNTHNTGTCMHTHAHFSAIVSHGQSFCFLRFHLENLDGSFLRTPTASVDSSAPSSWCLLQIDVYTRIPPDFWTPHRSALRSPAVTLRSSVRTHARAGCC